MPQKKRRGFTKELNIGEEVRMAATLKLNHFRSSEEEKEYEFPSSLTSAERAYIHRLAVELGLKSKSRGKGLGRSVTVYKREGSTIMQSDASLALSPPARKFAISLLNQYPVTSKERQELCPPTDRERNPYTTSETRDMTRAMGKLNSGIPQVPPATSTFGNDAIAKRRDLPIWTLRNEIVTSISQNQVTLVTGDTGSGKTTQVPQFILEHFSDQRLPCRIVCTQPRRLAAVAVAERVAYERDEKVGQTVGFQIRLESRVSPKTLLTFCTNGVLLRTLMGGDASLGTVTHIIVDEIHERDRFSDFLLTVIRDALNKFRGLKLVLMSATVDVQLFLNYFSGAKHVSVPGRLFPVKEFYLEDILLGIKYTSPAMEKQKKEGPSEGHQSRNQLLAAITKSLQVPGSTEDGKEQSCDDVILEDELEMLSIDEAAREKADGAISAAFLTGTQQTFDVLLKLVLEENYPLDYTHSKTGVTALMTACARGNVTALEQLLAAGADLDVRASNNWVARDFAICQDQPAALEMLDAYKQNIEMVSCDKYDALVEEENSVELTDDQKYVLALYHRSFDDDRVDHDLVIAVVKHIVMDSDEGAVLVFLPGYEDIVIVRDALANNPELSVLTLHSQMGSLDQKKVFRPAPPGARKVILSTNIAETSITIDDVVYVVDTGKVKETVWISATSTIQRKGRAGRVRPGSVYRLYSRLRHRALAPFQTPEILRTPLMELCLHTKLLAPPNTPIADFLNRAPQPPSFMVTRAAVQNLKTLEALDAWEDVTELGNHLLDLPVEPRLGKMVLYSVVLKCLDPVMTIVCCAAYRDPFLLPLNPALKKVAKESRRKFAGGSFSDHMALLRAFQGWQKARIEGSERSFCHHAQVSASTMEMVTGMRTQLLGQLRASGFVRSKGTGDIRDLNKNSENWAVVKAALTAGCYPSLARFDREAGQLRTPKESKVRLHPSSVCLSEERGSRGDTSSRANKASVSKVPTDWFIFDELTRAGHLAMIRGVTAVSPVTVLIFAGPNRLPMDVVSEADAGVQGNRYLEEVSDSEVEEKMEGENTNLRIDDWTVFRSDKDLAHLALQLRQKWSSLFLRRLHSPGKPMSQVDNSVVDTLVNILSAEEQSVGITQPTGIGQRPKPIPTEALCTSPGSTEPRAISSPFPAVSLPSVAAAGGTNGRRTVPVGSGDASHGGASELVSRGGGGGGTSGGATQFYQRTPFR